MYAGGFLEAARMYAGGFLEAAQTAKDLKLRILRSFAALRMTSYPMNLYPSPCTVTKCSGREGFASSFWRSEATCTSTVRVTGMAS